MPKNTFLKFKKVVFFKAEANMLTTVDIRTDGRIQWYMETAVTVVPGNSCELFTNKILTLIVLG